MSVRYSFEKRKKKKFVKISISKEEIKGGEKEEDARELDTNQLRWEIEIFFAWMA